MYKIIEKNVLLTLLFIFIFNNLLLFFNNGFYWDDWCLIIPESIIAITTGVGSSFMAPIHIYLMSINKYPALTYHLLILTLELISIVLLFKIFKKVSNNII